MDDGFLTWYSTLDRNVLKNVLNNLYPFIINFLDINIYYIKMVTWKHIYFIRKRIIIINLIITAITHHPSVW